MSVELVACPVCGAEQPALPRYPDYLCRECVGRAATADGRPLRLVNTSLSGGFSARYAYTGELAAEESVTHIVYVDGIRCHAGAGRLGGIVVQPQRADPDDAGEEP
jgi:hypothetical protein